MGQFSALVASAMLAERMWGRLMTSAGTISRQNMDPAEWDQRVNLAACYRLVEHFGWTDLIYTHISARVPNESGHFLLNRFGLLFEEVTASNLEIW
jgi:hypothetical protein